ACVVDENFIGAYIEKGKAYEKLKMFQAAIDCYKSALKLDEPSSYIFHRIGFCYESLKKLDKALKYYLRSVHEDPLADKTWVAIADLYLKKNNFRNALHLVNNALGIDEQIHLCLRRFAIIYKGLLLYEVAELGFRKSIEDRDNYLDTWLFWVDTLKLLAEFDPALGKLLQAR